MNTQKLKWGIVGTGNIAQQFVRDLKLLDDHLIVGVASRSTSKANNFAQLNGIEEFYGTYRELFASKKVDIVYIATPHNSHMEWTLEALEAGKYVLCEKPVAVNRMECERMVHKAREKKRFFMEALWTRFNPNFLKVLETIEQGLIGEVNYIKADFSFFVEEARRTRLMDPDLAGGSLLEMGIYPVFLAYFLGGKPTSIKAIARLNSRGSDLQCLTSLTFPKGVAQLMSGFCSESEMVAHIHGEKGRIQIHAPWHESENFVLIKGKKSHLFSSPKIGKGFTHEAIACKNAIEKGWIEHPMWTHQNSLDLMEILDEIRSQAGITYPFEANQSLTKKQ
ncbi:MAG: Gfo/Idh/MocA family oxidoreductase [Bacteroidota bacterium]